MENLDQLANSPSVDILLFTAEGGLGLTTLVNFARSEALKQGCHICTGKAVQMEQNNSFFVWRNVVLDLVHLVAIGSRNRQGHFRIPGNSGTVNMQDQVILPTSTLPSKPGSKPKRKDITVNTAVATAVLASNISANSEAVSSPVSHTGIKTERKLSRRPSSSAFRPASNTTPAETETQEAFNRRQSYSVGSGDHTSNGNMESPIEDEEQISIKFKKALEKIDLNENQAALLQLVTKSHEDESDAIAQAHLRLHAKDLCDILTKILNTITLHNKIVLQITESHWVDSLSWDLLLELSVACPRLSIITFSRPEATFESKENRRVYRLIEQLPRSKAHNLMGLSAQETEQLILATWNGHLIKSVDPKINETIFKRTDGNPFFIRSLVIALKDSGQWRISPTGMLTTPDVNFDFDKLVLGYDNQSIVLAQFDRLDRNFQLLLKVASVLGQKFALDDVLYFLTGIPNAADQIDRKNYNQIIIGLQNTDKYGFLQKDTLAPDGAYFQFKSALVRKCVYNMMVYKQRQQIHLLVAIYLEGKINDQNRHRYVVQILEHYMNTSASHKKKRIHYTAMAANYFFEKDSAGETIKYCKQLLELIEDATAEERSEITSLHIANCHRELGYALLVKEEYDEAEEHLKTALKIMGHSLPPDGYKFNWALKSEISKRKKLDRTFFKDRPVPQEEDYTQSYVARKGASGYSLSNLVVATAAVVDTKKKSDSKSDRGEEIKESSGNVLPKLATLSPAQQMIRDTRDSLLKGTQHALVTLAEVFLKKGNFNGHYYAILLGLNIATEESAEAHMSRLFALGALALRHLQTGDVNLPAQYMDAAVSFDLRIDIHTSLHQVTNNSTLLFLCGQLEASNNKCEVVSYLSTMASDLSSRVYGLHLKCMLQTHSSSREVALNTSRDLYNLSHQRESWFGKMWGCFHIIHNLLGDPNGEAEIQSKLKEMNQLWESCEDKANANFLPIEIAKETIQMLVPFYKKNSDPDLKESIQHIHTMIAKIPFHQWQSFAGLLPVCLTLIAGIERGQPLDPATVKIIDVLCDTANKTLKSIKGLSMSNSLRRVFKGIRLISKGKKSQAMKAWKKGIDEQSEDIYVQAILHSAIAKAGESEEAAEKAEDYIKDLKSKAKFAAIFS
ncbi:hypothetical protein HDU91_007182 [Kappamyces sp. JEL0680]|nr:hypothetical protein HDU91_007182 [Kappamyces sp. JEL0680]